MFKQTLRKNTPESLFFNPVSRNFKLPAPFGG